MFDKVGRMFKIDMQKLRSADSSHLFWMDLLMLLVVFFNLLYLSFGYLFHFSFFASFIHHLSPTFQDWYAQRIYHHVLRYDLGFVSIYISELIFRWIRSIYRKKYDRWWFYPFVHWYDVLMCIPIIQGYNLFGLLRLFGLFYRLQRLGVFDVTKTYVFKRTTQISEIMVEEVSDRVIAKMISMAQNEVNLGSPMVDRIIENVIKPKEDLIVTYLSLRISEAMSRTYMQHKDELKIYTEKIISEAIMENKTVDSLRFIPGLGRIFQETLDKAVGDITFKAIDKLAGDAIDPSNPKAIREVTHRLVETFLNRQHLQNDEFNQILIGMINDSLEEVKRTVLVKEWKIKQLEEEKHKLEDKIAKSV